MILANRDFSDFSYFSSADRSKFDGPMYQTKNPTFSDGFTDFWPGVSGCLPSKPLNIIQMRLISILTQEIADTFYTNRIFYLERDPKSTLRVTQ